MAEYTETDTTARNSSTNRSLRPQPDGKLADKGARPRADKYIIAFYVALCIISTIELYSASSREITSDNVFGPLLRHLRMMAIGIATCIVAARIQLKYYIRYTPVFVTCSVLAMIYVLINGDIINGARRSFSFFGLLSVQPVELLKISVVLIVAYIMSRTSETKGVQTKGVVWSAAIVLLFCGLMFNQGLTNTLLLMGISLSMMLIGGVQWKKFFAVLLVYGVVGAGAMAFKMHSSDDKDKKEVSTEQALIMETGVDAEGNKATIDRWSTWTARINRFLDNSKPKYEQPITSENRQEMYGYMAQANGGVFGVLPGNSRETARLPLAFSDYIFSIVVEDWGFIGGFLLLFIYLSLLGRAGVIAMRCDRAFPSMVILGLAVMIVIQALFHMAIVTGVFPVSGQPLPMISMGGTSMIVTSLAFGIMLSISKYVSVEGRKKSSSSADNTDELGAANPTQISNI